MLSVSRPQLPGRGQRRRRLILTGVVSPACTSCLSCEAVVAVTFDFNHVMAFATCTMRRSSLDAGPSQRSPSMRTTAPPGCTRMESDA